MFCKLILPTNEIHKLCSLPETFDLLHQTIQTKLQNKIPSDFSLKYKDSDEELITLSCDDDLQAAIMAAKNEDVKTLRIFILPNTDNIMAPSDKPILTSLSNIPEAPEKSRSSLEEPSSIGGSYIKFPEAKGIEGPLKSCSRFSLSRIPKTHSLIFDDIETIHSMTPFSEKPGEAGSRKRVFTFTRMNSLDDPIDEEYINPGNLGKGVLTEEQVEFLSNLIDNRLNEDLDESIRRYTLEFLSRIYDDVPFVSPERSSPYNLSMLSKSMVHRSANRRHTLQGFRGPSHENLYCAGCNTEVHGIKYICLSCANYTCCENCESEVDHPHPLLKIRPAQQQQQHQPYEQHSHHHYQQQYQHEMKRNSPIPSNASPVHMINRPSAGTSARKSHRHTTAAPGLLSLGSDSQLANITRLYENYMNTPQSNNSMSQPSPTLPAKKPAGILRRGNTLGALPSLKGGPVVGPRSGGGLSSSRYSSKTMLETDGKYKATITKPSVYDFINIHPGQEYNIQLIVKNSGENKWAEEIKLICINGRDKGMEIPVHSLSPSEEQALSVNLVAPQQSGRCLSQWKLHYGDEGVMKAFGRAIYIDIEVHERERTAEETPEADESLEEERQDDVGETPREEDPDKILMKGKGIIGV